MDVWTKARKNEGGGCGIYACEEKGYQCRSANFDAPVGESKVPRNWVDACRRGGTVEFKPMP